MLKVKLAARRLVRTLSAFFPAQRPFSRKEPFLRKKGSARLFLPILSYGGALSVQVSKKVTKMVRHYSQDERQSDAALHWDAFRTVLLKAFAKHGARDFSDQQWLRFVHEGSSKTRIEYCEDSKNSLAYFRAIQGHTGGIPIDPELMECIRIPFNWKRFIYHRLCSFTIQSILENGLITGGHESDKFNLSWRMDRFWVDMVFTPLNPFGGDSEEERRDDYTVPQKNSLPLSLQTKSRCCVLYKISRAQDQGLQFWQTKSHAIIVHSPVPANCICWVISQNGDRILIERLSTPRPAPKVTLKSNWQSQKQQQQQQSTCDDVTSTRRLVRESQSGTRDVRGYTTDDQIGTWRPVRALERAVDKKPKFESDFWVEGVPKDANF